MGLFCRHFLIHKTRLIWHVFNQHLGLVLWAFWKNVLCIFVCLVNIAVFVKNENILHMQIALIYLIKWRRVLSSSSGAKGRKMMGNLLTPHTHLLASLVKIEIDTSSLSLLDLHCLITEQKLIATTGNEEWCTHCQFPPVASLGI